MIRQNVEGVAFQEVTEGLDGEVHFTVKNPVFLNAPGEQYFHVSMATLSPRGAIFSCFHAMGYHGNMKIAPLGP